MNLSFRRLPVGAELTPEGVHFRVWAPKRKKVEVATDTGSFELEAEGDGYFSGIEFPSLKSPEMRACIPDPHEPSTFEICRLDLSERESHGPCYALHRDLLRLRREDPVFRAQGAGGLDGAVLTPEAFVLRYFSEGDDRLLVVNLGRDLHLVPAPEPLLAPPDGASWEVVWSSEDPRYGGCGAPPPEDREGGWRLAGQAAVVLRPKERT